MPKAGEARVGTPHPNQYPQFFTLFSTATFHQLQFPLLQRHPPISALLTWGSTVTAHDSIFAVAAESWGVINPAGHLGALLSTCSSPWAPEGSRQTSLLTTPVPHHHPTHRAREWVLPLLQQPIPRKLTSVPGKECRCPQGDSPCLGSGKSTGSYRNQERIMQTQKRERRHPGKGHPRQLHVRGCGERWQ